jgi:hypothetical protein
LRTIYPINKKQQKDPFFPEVLSLISANRQPHEKLCDLSPSFQQQRMLRPLPLFDKAADYYARFLYLPSVKLS